ncbi:MAG: hypothetical protein J5507_04975 [Clostridia bacterium]|nr:hypothetical protein [Clostridia bacterium]
MRKSIKTTEAIFPMPVLMIANYNEEGSIDVIEYQDDQYGAGVIGKFVNVTADEKVMNGEKIDINLVNAIAFDPYTHGYYKVSERVGDAFKDGLKIKKDN